MRMNVAAFAALALVVQSIVMHASGTLAQTPIIAPVQAQLRGQLLDHAFRQLLPLKVPLQIGDLDLIEIEYCGNRSSGKLVGLAVPGQTQVDESANATRYVNCSDNLDAIAARALAGSNNRPWSVALALEPNWQPWSLVIRLDDFAAQGPAAAPLSQALNDLKQQSPELASIALQDLRIDIGADQPLQYSVALQFGRSGVDLALLPPNLAAGAAAGTPVAFNLLGIQEPLPNMANTIVSVDVLHINEGLTQRFTQSPLPVDLPVGEGNIVLNIKQLRIDASPGRLEGHFQIYVDDPNKTLPVVLRYTGTDLRVDRAFVPLPPNDCSQRPSRILRQICEGLYNLNASIARAIGNGITNQIRGKPLRPLTKDRKINLSLHGGAAAFTSVVLQSSSSGGRIVLYMDSQLEK